MAAPVAQVREMSRFSCVIASLILLRPQDMQFSENDEQDAPLASDAVRGDLVRILTKLLKKKKRGHDGIIIETTGLADPAPLAQTFFVDVRCLYIQACNLTCTSLNTKGSLHCCC